MRVRAVARQKPQIDQQQPALSVRLEWDKGFHAAERVVPGIVEQIDAIGDVVTLHTHARISVLRRLFSHRVEGLHGRTRRCGIPSQKFVLVIGAMQLPEAKTHENKGANDG